MALDPEVNAMNQTLDALKTLNNWQRKRIVDWITARFKLNEADKFEPPAEDTAGTGESMPIKKTRKPRAKKAIAAENGVKNFDTVLELFAEANVKKVSSKILLMAAYLQEKLNYEEISSFDINSRLKRIRHGVTNISSSINGIVKRKPQLLAVVEKPGEEQPSRRKFRVTEEGLKLVQSFLKK